MGSGSECWWSLLWPGGQAHIWLGRVEFVGALPHLRPPDPIRTAVLRAAWTPGPNGETCEGERMDWDRPAWLDAPTPTPDVDHLAEVSRILGTASYGDVVADAQAAMARQVEIADELARVRADLEVARAALTLMDPQALRSVVELLGGAPREGVAEVVELLERLAVACGECDKAADGALTSEDTLNKCHKEQRNLLLDALPSVNGWARKRDTLRAMAAKLVGVDHG
jgi:hypothetical protein